jgi:putative transposase
VTYNRKQILIENIEYLRESFKQTLQKHQFEIVAIVVNPDHIHMIIKPDNISDYPKIIGTLKKSFTQISKIEHTVNNNRESDIWQRRYWEHTIRDEQDLYKHLDYIHYNPVKHGLVKSPKEWEYSSFKKFVEMGLYEENWCNFNDENKISKMDLE